MATAKVDHTPHTTNLFSGLDVVTGAAAENVTIPEITGARWRETSMGVAHVWTAALYQGQAINLVYEVCDFEGTPMLRLSYPSVLKQLTKAITRIDKTWYRMTLLRDFSRFRLSYLTSLLGKNYAAHATARATKIKEAVETARTKAAAAAKQAAAAGAVQAALPAPVVDPSIVTIDTLNTETLGAMGTYVDTMVAMPSDASRDVGTALTEIAAPSVAGKLRRDFATQLAPMQQTIMTSASGLSTELTNIQHFRELPKSAQTEANKKAAAEALVRAQGYNSELKRAEGSVQQLRANTLESVAFAQRKYPKVVQAKTQSKAPTGVGRKKP